MGTSSLKPVQIGPFTLGDGHPVFIIAEAGVNHNGDVALARRLIDAALEAGADAVKFQTFQTDELVLPDAKMAEYQRTNLGSSISQNEMLRGVELTFEDHQILADHAQRRGILFLSTPHSGTQSVEWLDRLGVPAYKVGSGELTNLPFLEDLAGRRKPILLSTGMATMEEVSEAVETIRSAGCSSLVVLHCTSEYPCPPEDVHLLAMRTIADECNAIVGYSDHTLGSDAAVLATRLGAVCLEKHLTLDQDLPGPDHRASMEPAEFRNYVDAARKAESSPFREDEHDEPRWKTLLGRAQKQPTPAERDTARLVRKSLVTARSIERGRLVVVEDLAIKRPGTGLAPKKLREMIGRTWRNDLPAHHLITAEDFA